MYWSVYFSLLACFLISKALASNGNDTNWHKSLSEEPSEAELAKAELNCYESLCIPKKYDRTKIPSGVQVWLTSQYRFVYFLSVCLKSIETRRTDLRVSVTRLYFLKTIRCCEKEA